LEKLKLKFFESLKTFFQKSFQENEWELPSRVIKSCSLLPTCYSCAGRNLQKTQGNGLLFSRE